MKDFALFWIFSFLSLSLWVSSVVIIKKSKFPCWRKMLIQSMNFMSFTTSIVAIYDIMYSIAAESKWGLIIPFFTSTNLFNVVPFWYLCFCILLYLLVEFKDEQESLLKMITEINPQFSVVGYSKVLFGIASVLGTWYMAYSISPKSSIETDVWVSLCSIFLPFALTFSLFFRIAKGDYHSAVKLWALLHSGLMIGRLLSFLYMYGIPKSNGPKICYLLCCFALVIEIAPLMLKFQSIEQIEVVEDEEYVTRLTNNFLQDYEFLKTGRFLSPFPRCQNSNDLYDLYIAREEAFQKLIPEDYLSYLHNLYTFNSLILEDFTDVREYVLEAYFD